MTKRALIVLLMLFCFPSIALSHNVVGGAYAIGNVIEGEVGFSNGEMAAEGTVIIVSDANDNELGRTETDAEGFFVFEATQRIDHYFYADLSAGHVLEMSLPFEELPDTLQAGNVAENGTDSASLPSELPLEDSSELQALIEKAVAKQVVPLRKEIAELKEKAGLRDIIGGIGYIFGLCGLGIWWRQRQLDKQKAT